MSTATTSSRPPICARLAPKAAANPWLEQAEEDDTAHRDADRVADLLGGGQRPGDRPGRARVRVRQHRGGQRGDAQPLSRAEQEQPGEQRGQRAADSPVPDGEHQQQVADGAADGAGGDHPRGRTGRSGPARAARSAGSRPRGRRTRRRTPALQAPALLQEQRQQEVAGGLLAPEQRLHGQADPQRADREDGGVEQRLPAAVVLGRPGAGSQRIPRAGPGPGEARPRPAGRPAGGRRRAAARSRPGPPPAGRRPAGQFAGPRGPGFGDQPPRRRQGDQADRHVDPEDGPPIPRPATFASMSTPPISCPPTAAMPMTMP